MRSFSDGGEDAGLVCQGIAGKLDGLLKTEQEGGYHAASGGTVLRRVAETNGGWTLSTRKPLGAGYGDGATKDCEESRVEKSWRSGPVLAGMQDGCTSVVPEGCWWDRWMAEKQGQMLGEMSKEPQDGVLNGTGTLAPPAPPGRGGWREDVAGAIALWHCDSVEGSMQVYSDRMNCAALFAVVDVLLRRPSARNPTPKRRRSARLMEGSKFIAESTPSVRALTTCCFAGAPPPPLGRPAAAGLLHLAAPNLSPVLAPLLLYRIKFGWVRSARDTEHAIQPTDGDMPFLLVPPTPPHESTQLPQLPPRRCEAHHQYSLQRFMLLSR
ncbi:hypothetical protein L1887_46830 [Cichorium endivia]|nr:hypothetical protein L1887_46830 [Cichorium endivia]